MRSDLTSYVENNKWLNIGLLQLIHSSQIKEYSQWAQLYNGYYRPDQFYIVFSRTTPKNGFWATLAER